MNLSQEQRNAVYTDSAKALCLAGAGSGKTRVLTSRIKYLIEEYRISPYDIMSISFTRKSAGEMRDRLEKMIGSKAYHITTGTIHSVALKMIQRFGEYVGLKPNRITVYSDWEENFLLKDVCSELGYHNGKTWKGIKKADIDYHFFLLYTEGRRVESAYDENIIMNAFFTRCRENNALTYGSILTTFYDLLPKISHLIRYDHLLVDEVQDLDTLQWMIINRICELCNTSLFVVGDDSQCQPAGTLVETLDGYKLIEDLDHDSDELYVYDKHDAMIYGGHNKGYKFKKSSRIFTGFMYNISANKMSTRCTPNHKWWVKWSEYGRNLKWNVVYLMKQGTRFRIGWCQLFRGSGKNNKKTAFHLWQRARIEKADAVWVLRVFDNKKDASIWETILSTRFGIPTIPFEGVNNSNYYDKNGINQVFYWIGDLTEKAKKIIKYHNLEFDYPFHSIERNNQKRGGCSVFEIEACNMIPQFFMIPHRINKTRYIEWSVANIEFCFVKNVTVYSMNVEKYHTYIADGLCTKNSIYSFRGASPEYLVKHQNEFDIYKLEDNYRSDKNIVDCANRLIKHNIDRLDLVMNSKRTAVNRVSVLNDIDSKFLFKLIHSDASENIAVLGRNHFLLENLSSILEDNNIEHEYIGKKSALVRSEKFRKVNSFLKLVINQFDNFSFMLIRRYLDISTEEYRYIRMKAVKEDKSHFQVFNELYSSSEYLDALKTISFEKILDYIESVDFDFDSTSIIDFIRLYIAAKHNASVFDYLNWLAIFDTQDEISAEPKRVQLLTIHASKGLEWDTVYVAGMNERIFPSDKSTDDERELESERRLAYVAYTRAIDSLFLTVRPTKDNKGRLKYPISRFIDESL